MPDRTGTVLVVDDHKEFVDMIVRWLRDDYEVRTANTGMDALNLITDDVDVVLLDRKLPDMSGDEVARQIRNQEIDCCVAMLTAVDPDTDILQLGFDDYLVKPTLRTEIESTVEKLLIRSSFNTRIRERYALSEKLTTLESEKPLRELRDSNEYEEALKKLDELNTHLDRLVNESIEKGSVITMYKDIESKNGIKS